MAKSLELDVRACSICGNNVLLRAYADEEFGVYRCPICGTLLSTYEAPDLAKHYDAAYFRHFEAHYKEFRLRQYRRVLPGLSDISPGRRLLDVGCGLGYFVEEAQRDGWDAAGVDISEAAIAYATRERRVPNLLCARFEDYLSPASGFHAITFWDVLEHMPRPREALQRAHDLLVDGGIIVVKVPSAGGPNLNAVLLASLLSGKLVDKVKPYFRGHFYYFTARSIRHLVESAGFSVLTLRRQPERLIIFEDRRPATLAKVGIKYLLSLPELLIPAARSEILVFGQKGEAR